MKGIIVYIQRTQKECIFKQWALINKYQISMPKIRISKMFG